MPLRAAGMDRILGTDIPRVVADLTVLNAGHGSTNVHPLFVMFLNPFGRVATNFFEILREGRSENSLIEYNEAPPMEKLKNSELAGASFVTACAGALGVSLIFFVFRGLKLKRRASVLLSTAYGLSSGQLLFSVIPETFIFGGTTLLAAYNIVLMSIRMLHEDASRKRKVFLWLLPLGTVIAYSMTITNIMQAVIANIVIAAAAGSKNILLRERLRDPVMIGLFAIAFTLSIFPKRFQPTPMLPLLLVLIALLHFGFMKMKEKIDISLGPWMYAGVALVVAVYISGNLSLFQRVIYPTSNIPFNGRVPSLSYIELGSIGGEDLQKYPRESIQRINASTAMQALQKNSGVVIRNFAVYGIFAAPVVAGCFKGGAIVDFQDPLLGYSIGSLVLFIIIFALAALGVVHGLQKERTFTAITLASIGSSVLLHVFFDPLESFLYSPHVVFLIFFLVCLGVIKLENQSSQIKNASEIVAIVLAGGVFFTTPLSLPRWLVLSQKISDIK